MAGIQAVQTLLKQPTLMVPFCRPFSWATDCSKYSLLFNISKIFANNVIENIKHPITITNVKFCCDVSHSFHEIQGADKETLNVWMDKTTQYKLYTIDENGNEVSLTSPMLNAGSDRIVLSGGGTYLIMDSEGIKVSRENQSFDLFDLLKELSSKLV
jgi:hypothetical protein